MTDNATSAMPAPPAPILDDSEVAGRLLLLAELQAALAGLGVRCVLARQHRLVLRYNDPPPLAPSGPLSPTLHILAPDGARTIATDGTTYQLDGAQLPVADPAAAAAMICHALKPAART